jgi:hypothetical protein
VGDDHHGDHREGLGDKGWMNMQGAASSPNDSRQTKPKIVL